jgi:chemotaxis family two-component system sensor kinase Cph1
MSRSLSHGAGIPLGPTDCQAAFQASLGDLQLAIAESGAAVTADPLPTVSGNAPCLQQLFLNLIGNALKFHGTETPCVHVGVERQGDHWLFAVRDNGIGIAPQFIDRIFTVFQRLHSKEEYPGTGIGLATCKRIVERHHGQIWVESTFGQGAVFCFTLPLATAEPDRAGAAVSSNGGDAPLPAASSK